MHTFLSRVFYPKEGLDVSHQTLRGHFFSNCSPQDPSLSFLNVEHQVLTLFLIDHQFNELAFDVPKVYTGLSSLVTSNYDTPPLIPAL